MVNGIDVSKWQGSGTDFWQVKTAGIDFVIIRAGLGRLASQKDPCFEQNYKKAVAAGLKVGAYWYSYANSADDAVREAKACLEVIKGKKLDYPIYFDLENKWQFLLGKKFCSKLVEAFCSTLEDAGYFAGLYMSRWYLQNYITPEVARRYAVCAGGVLGISFWQTADYCEFPQVNSKNYPLIYVKNRGLPKESP